MAAFENATWPMALARVSNGAGGPLGYAPGVSARDLAPAEVRHLVHENFDKFPPPDPRIHYLIGMLYIVLGLMAASGNFYVLKIFAKYKQLRTPSNVLVMNLAFCDLMLFAGLFPELILNCFANGGVWMFGPTACIVHAWFGTTMGFGQMVTLSFIAYDRYYVIVKGMAGSPPSYKRSGWMLAYIWVVSLFWGTSPALGLGKFRLDGILSSCSYDYMTPELNIYLYIYISWFFGFALPIFQIVYCYFFIVKAVVTHEQQLREQARKMNVKSLRSSENSHKSGGISAEVKVAKIALLSITFWLFAWTPFTLMSFVGLYDPMRITPILSSLPVICAKSSAVYNPIVYALSHPKYQECLRAELGWLCGANANKKLVADLQSTDTVSE